jgi:hypothetical protein
MDMMSLLADQERRGFADLAGSGGQGVVRVSERLLNAAIAEQLQGSPAIRELQVAPRAGDRFGVRVLLAKPSFLPPITLEVVIDKQPSLPDDPVLGLTLSGMGGLLRFAGPLAGFFTSLPPGVRLEGERVFVDLRAVLAERGLGTVLNYVEAARVTSEQGRLVLSFQLRVRE